LNLLKCKDDVNLLNDVIVNNRNTLKLFNDLYTKIKNNQINSDNIYEMYDKNKSRFLKNLEIIFKICSNEKIINSNLVFPLYTFNSIKKTSIDSFIKLIEEMV
jgi:pyruvate-formate lyase-activating enzyme